MATEIFDRDGALDLAKFHRDNFHHSIGLFGCSLCRSPLQFRCHDPNCDFEATIKSTPQHDAHMGVAQ